MTSYGALSLFCKSEIAPLMTEVLPVPHYPDKQIENGSEDEVEIISAIASA